MARTYRTLEELRTQVRAACGFAASGAVAGANALLIDQKIRLAQSMLYEAGEWAHLRKYEDKTLGAGAYLLDYPTTANNDRIRAISALRGTVWSPPLERGITPEMYTTQDNTSWPQRWEPYEQIEIWPKADQAYTVRIFFIKLLDPFTADGDRASLDDQAIEEGAIALAKAHYRQPDAELYLPRFEERLWRLKEKSRGKIVFNPNDYKGEPLARPVVV